MVRIYLNFALAVAAGFFLGAMSAYALRVSQPAGHPIAGGVLREAGQAQIGGAFRLIDQNGRAFTEQELRGKPSLLVFGYTGSPDLTPAALNVISEAIDASGLDGEAVRVVFVSLDWERDSPEALKRYLDRFRPGIIGLTGSEEEVRSMAASFKLAFHKRTASDGTSEIVHSQLLFALDANGSYVSHLWLPASVDKVVSLLRRLHT